MSETNNKYSIYPIQHKELWDLYKKCVDNLWLPEHIELADDRKDFDRLSEGDWYFIKMVLAFFNQADGIVNENLAARFYREATKSEARAFYSFQMWTETVHAETYSRMLEAYVTDEAERERLFNAIENIPAIAKKAQWALKWLDSQESPGLRLIAFAIVEGLFFSGSFCAIHWLRKRGILPGLCRGNDAISRDEASHCEFARIYFHSEGHKVSEADFRKIMMEAVEIEREFVTESLPVSLIGMNAKLMAQYIENVADTLTVEFGFKPIYNSLNPFEFLLLQGVETKINFFEGRSSEYRQLTDRKIGFDEEF